MMNAEVRFGIQGTLKMTRLASLISTFRAEAEEEEDSCLAQMENNDSSLVPKRLKFCYVVKWYSNTYGTTLDLLRCQIVWLPLRYSREKCKEQLPIVAFPKIAYSYWYVINLFS